MTRTHDDMRENAQAWLWNDDNTEATRETAVNDQHLALDVIDLLADLTRLTSALAEAERERDEARAGYAKERDLASSVLATVDDLRFQLSNKQIERDACAAEMDRQSAVSRHLRELLGEVVGIASKATMGGNVTAKDVNRITAIAKEAGL